ADNVSVVIRSTLVQVLTPGELLGRVSSVNSIFIGSSNEIGAFESGVAARILGTVPAVVLGGFASLAVVGIVAMTIPALRRMRVTREIAGRPVRPSEDGTALPKRISEYFGIITFGARQMRDKLPKAVYQQLVASVRQGKKLDPDVAPPVAKAIKEWAISRG